MELVFNELSISPLSNNKYSANDKMVLFSMAVAEARRKGFRHIRTAYSSSEINLAANYTLHNWLFDKEFPEIYRSLFYGMFVQPFINEEDEETEDKYIEASYFFEDINNGITKQECLGLASAYLSESLLISFQSSPSWLNNILKIIIEKDSDFLTDDVFNVFSNNCFNAPTITTFVENIGNLSLIETEIHPDNKHIHLADHHGKDELEELCNRLKYNRFVIEIRSMEWCRGKCNDFIKKFHPDGTVEIVLYKTDSKYALLVKTTGRNLRETKAIAEILSEEYS